MAARRSLLVFAAAAMVAAAGPAGCTGEADFDQGEAADVTRALRDAGLRTCGAPRDETPPPDAVSARTLEVDERCAGDDDPRTLVRLVEWEDEGARDAAASRYEAGGDGRRSQSAAGATWTYGPFTITVSGERDDDEAERVADAMQALEAK